MRTIECESREAWLEERRNGIGASDAPTVLGLSKWSNRVELFQQKLGLLPPKESTQQMKWGSKLEPLIRAEFAEMSGIPVSYWGAHTICVHEKNPWMRASLDGVAEIDGKQAIVEIKAVSAAQKESWERELPVYYQAQMQHQMAVTGFDSAMLVVLFGGQDLQWYPVQRHPEFQELLMREEQSFWDAVESRDPPSPQTPDEMDALARSLLKVVEGKTVRCPELMEFHREIVELRRQNARIQERLKAFRNAVIVAAQDAETVEVSEDVHYRVKLIQKKPYMVKEQKYRVVNLVGGDKDGDA